MKRDNSRLLLFVAAASFDCVNKEISFAECVLSAFSTKIQSFAECF